MKNTAVEKNLIIITNRRRKCFPLIWGNVLNQHFTNNVGGKKYEGGAERWEQISVKFI